MGCTRPRRFHRRQMAFPRALGPNRLHGRIVAFLGRPVHGGRVRLFRERRLGRRGATFALQSPMDRA